MLQARMATRVAKPNGQFWLRPDDVASFMLDKKVTDLPGQDRISFSSVFSPAVFSCSIIRQFLCFSCYHSSSIDAAAVISHFEAFFCFAATQFETM